MKPKIILGIESSCDETAAAVVQKEGDRVTLLSNIVASSADLQSKYGGVIPEQAAREQLKSIIPVIEETLLRAFEVGNEKCEPDSLKSRDLDIKNSISKTSHLSHLISKIDAIAVTEGPGLIGSLLVGVETAKVLSIIWQKPLVPVNHLLGHFYANWIQQEESSRLRSNNSSSSRESSNREAPITPSFPCIGLLVSGGHTDLVLFKSHGKYEYLGGTRDDAAGECFDKCARLLGLGYPGGPIISKLAEKGNPKAYKLPRPMINSKDFDFSFSGLKTAVLNLVQEMERGVTRKRAPDAAPAMTMRTDDGKLERQDPEREQIMNNLCASIQQAILDVLITKTIQATKVNNVTQIVVAGGVAANQMLSSQLVAKAKLKIPHAGVFSAQARTVFMPPPSLCTDNAAYIAAAAFYNFNPADPLTLQANPNLSLSG